MKLFCAGVGDGHPDATNASRAHEEERVRRLPEERRQGHRRDQDRLRRPHPGAVQAGPADQADARPALPGARQGSARRRTASSSPIRTRTGRTSTSRCPTPRSRCSARRRPPAPATRCTSCSWRRAPSRFRRSPRSRSPMPRRSSKAWKSLREDGAYVEAGENDNVIVAEARSQQERVRHLRLLVPRRERGQAARRAARRRRADLRQHRRRQVQGLAPAVRLHQEAARRRGPRHRQVRGRVRVAARRSARTAISPRRAS